MYVIEMNKIMFEISTYNKLGIKFMFSVLRLLLQKLQNHYYVYQIR